MKSAPVFDMPNLGSTINMNNYHYKFIAKRSQIKDKDEFIAFYQDNLMILQMIEFCETVNPDSIRSKIISVDTAAEFFSFMSNGIEDEK